MVTKTENTATLLVATAMTAEPHARYALVSLLVGIRVLAEVLPILLRQILDPPRVLTLEESG